THAAPAVRTSARWRDPRATTVSTSSASESSPTSRVRCALYTPSTSTQWLPSPGKLWKNDFGAAAAHTPTLAAPTARYSSAALTKMLLPRSTCTGPPDPATTCGHPAHASAYAGRQPVAARNLWLLTRCDRARYSLLRPPNLVSGPGSGAPGATPSAPAMAAVCSRRVTGSSSTTL